MVQTLPRTVLGGTTGEILFDSVRAAGSTRSEPDLATDQVSEDWLDEVSIQIRASTLANLSIVNSCIFATRVAQEVFSRVGLTVRAQPVWVTAFNREAKALADDGTPMALWPVSAWSVGTDERNGCNETEWNGHLVLVLRRPGRPRLLMDMTADQFHRPDRGIFLDGPVLLDLPSGTSWTPQDPSWLTLPGSGVAVCYRPMSPGHPSARSWSSSPDWLLSSETIDEFATAILAKAGAPF